MKRSLTELFLEIEEDQPFSEELFIEIRRRLAWEIRRRGAGRRLSPRIFGCIDWDDWDDLRVSGSNDEILSSSGPLMDLAVDCYEYAVIRRFDSLRSQADQKKNIDGLFAANIRNFVTERQGKADPCGTATYRNVKAVVEELVHRDVLGVRRLRRGSVYNETLLVLDAEEAREPAEPEELKGWISSRAESFEIAGKLGATVSVDVQSELGELLKVASEELGAFYFGDLVSAWKRLARNAYEGVRYREEDDLVRHAVADDEGCRDPAMQVRDEERGFAIFEEFHDLRRDLERLRRAVEMSGRQKRVRRRMLEIVDVLSEELLDRDRDEVASQAEMAHRLDISTSTYSDYIVRLREVMEERSSDK